MKTFALAFTAAALAVALPATGAAPPGKPGAADVSRVPAGNYKVDKGHTQVVWTVDHIGVSPLSGAFGAAGGTLELDPAKPAAAKVTVTFNTAEQVTTTPAFTKHLSTADLFDIEKFPTIAFTSTAVQAEGQTAKITGNLTIKGVTKPVTLDAKFFGAGVNPNTKALNVGFSGLAHIKRSDFGLGYAVPVVGDDVELRIHAAFEKVG